MMAVTKNCLAVTEISRVDMTTEVLVRPRFSLPNLLELNDMRQENRSVIFNVLGVAQKVAQEVVTSTPGDIRLVLMALAYWERKTSPPKYYRVALLVCMVQFWPLELTDADAEQSTQSSEFGQSLLEKCPVKELQDARLTLFRERLVRTPTPLDDDALLHVYAQFQACLFAIIHLNKLLQCPFQNPNPADFYNGTFLYHFTTWLKSQSDEKNDQPISCVKSLLEGESPSVWSYFYNLYTNLSSLVPDS